MKKKKKKIVVLAKTELYIQYFWLSTLTGPPPNVNNTAKKNAKYKFNKS